MKKTGVLLMACCIAGCLVGAAVNADQAAGAQTQFKEKLAQAAGQPGPFSNVERFPKTYFLIPDNLPFMVGLTLIHPMSKQLKLSDRQKAKIQAIKKTTVPIVLKSASKIKSLELTLAQQVIENKAPDTLTDLVEQIGSLRIELTKKHLHCIKQVREILTPDQYKILLSYAGKS